MSESQRQEMILSRYTVSSPLLFDRSIETYIQLVLSTRTGATIALNSRASALLESGDYDALDPECFEQIVAAGILVPVDTDEFSTIMAENRAAIDSASTLYQCVLPSAWCQLGCDYCGQKHQGQLMMQSEQDALLQRIEATLRSRRYDTLHINWFGGEPLTGLKVIRSLTVKLMEQATRYDCQYESSMVTNGVSLSADIADELLHDLGVKSVEVTLDGTAPSHDGRRHTKSGQPTFDQIFSNLIAIAEDKCLNSLVITLRCNVDSRNESTVSDLIDLLATSPLRDRVGFYVAPIHDWSNEASQASLTKQEFAEREIEWLAQMLRQGMRPALLPRRKPVVCLAVSDHGEVSDPWGKHFRCTEHALVDKFAEVVEENTSVKPFETKPSRPKDGLSNFLELVEEGRYDCKSCQMFPVCGGACPKSWLDGSVPCPSAKFNMPERLVLAYAGTLLQQSP